MPVPSFGFESLEGRRLLSTTLRPSAVEGVYHGYYEYDSKGSTVENSIKLTITSTAAKIMVTGVGTATTPLSAKSFKTLRNGVVSESFSKDGLTLTLYGKVTHGGLRFAGDFTVKGKGSAKGIFSVKKIET